jgi:hypothetical protein
MHSVDSAAQGVNMTDTPTTGPTKTPPPDKYPLVEVVWVDAEEQGEVGWNDLKEMLKYSKKQCPTMKSVGYVLYRGKHHISLADTVGPDECSTVQKIPTEFIREIRELKR